MSLFAKLFGKSEAPDAKQLRADGALLIDARSPVEFAGGHLEGAVNLPHDVAAQRIGEIERDTNRPIVVYCQSGGRSAMAEKSMRGAGFKTVVNIGGIDQARRALES